MILETDISRPKSTIMKLECMLVVNPRGVKASFFNVGRQLQLGWYKEESKQVALDKSALSCSAEKQMVPISMESSTNAYFYLPVTNTFTSPMLISIFAIAWRDRYLPLIGGSQMKVAESSVDE